MYQCYHSRISKPTDVHENPRDGTTVLVATTGVDDYDIDAAGDGADTFGTLYTVTTDFTDMSVVVTILYDGNTDPQRLIRSPDNVHWSDTDGTVCVTEDKAASSTLRGEPVFGEGAVNAHEAGVVCLLPSSHETARNVERIAEVNRDAIYDGSIEEPTEATDVSADTVGAWESSGIIEVTELFDKQYVEENEKLYLLGVQAHGLKDQDEFGMGSRLTDDDLVEGGQLLLLSIRGSTTNDGTGMSIGTNTSPSTVDDNSGVKTRAEGFNKAGLFGLLALPFAILSAVLLVIWRNKAPCPPASSSKDNMEEPKSSWVHDRMNDGGPPPLPQDPSTPIAARAC